MTNHDKFLLCLVEAHCIVASVKRQYPIEAQACGDPAAPSTSESTTQVMLSLQTYLPGLLAALGNSIGPLEQKQFESQAVLSPKMAAVDQAIQRSNALSQAGTDAQVLGGPGGQLVRDTSKLNAEIDPEFFKTRAAQGAASERLLGGLDFGDSLSGAERAEVERSLNRDNIKSGTMDTPSAIQTISNALSFGRAGEARKSERQKTATNAIGAVGAVNPGTRQGIDPLQTAVGRNSSPGINTSVGNASLGVGNSLLGQIGGMRQQENEINANRRDVYDRIAQGVGSISC